MKDYVSSRNSQFLDDFKTIVNIDSSSENLHGIKKVARFFEKRFLNLGLDTKVLFLGKNKVPCLVAEKKEENKAFDIMFLGHMDTVFPFGEVERRPFSIEGNKAFGPGVCDMKGGLLVVLHVLETLKEKGILDRLSVCVAFNGDEETGSSASKKWIMDIARQSLRTFVFEPCRPGFRSVLERKGGGWFYITIEGRKAHAGADPEKGVNAVVELAHQIVKINGLNDNNKGTSAQVTVISGGDKVNIIPSRAEASIDVRVLRLDEKKRVEAFFNDFAKSPYFKESKIVVKGEINRPPMEPDNSTQNLWDMIQKTGVSIKLTMEWISTGGCSDGNYTSFVGTPTIDGLGIVGANSHRLDEYADLESIDKMVLLVAMVCKKISELS